MDCREWEEKLDDLLEGRLPAAGRAAALEHASACARCGELYAVAGAGLAGLTDPAGSAPEPPADLAAAVLARTTGPACGRARELLAARGDARALGAEEAALLAGHVDHCAECHAFDTTLAWLLPTLREMAEVEPDPEFAYDVLRATSAVRLARRGAAGWRAHQKDRLGGWWRRQITRPHFAAEAAYALTLALVLLFGTPVSPLRQVTPKALHVVQATPLGIATAARDVLGALPGGAGSLGRAAWDATGGRVESAAGGAATGFVRRARVTVGIGDGLSHNAAELGGALLRHDVVQAAARWSDIRSDLKRLWTTWLGKAPEAAAPPVQPVTMEPRRQT